MSQELIKPWVFNCFGYTFSESESRYQGPTSLTGGKHSVPRPLGGWSLSPGKGASSWAFCSKICVCDAQTHGSRFHTVLARSDGQAHMARPSRLELYPSIHSAPVGISGEATSKSTRKELKTKECLCWSFTSRECAHP